MAQQFQKCCSTSNSTFLLGNTEYARHTQSLYLANDFPGAVAGNIVKLYFRYGNTGQELGNTYGDLTIRLGHADIATFSSVTFLTGLQTVLSSTATTVPPGATGNWFSFDLTTLFTYDPSRALVVEIIFNSSSTNNFGTLSQGGLTNRKLMSASTSAVSGEYWNTVQDLGFDLTSVGLTDHARLTALLYPNPARTHVTLQWGDPLPSTTMLELLDASGRSLIVEQVPSGAQRHDVWLGGLTSGAYFIRLRNSDGLMQTQKLLLE